MKKTQLLCGKGAGSAGSRCPKLTVTRAKKLRYHITDDYGGLVKLTEAEARNLALAIFVEVGKQ